MVEFCLINILSACFLVKNKQKASSLILIAGFCFLVYDKNSYFLNYQHIEKVVYDIILLLLFLLIQVEIFRKDATPFQIAHANVYNIFYLVTVFIWCCKKYSHSYFLIIFFFSACVIIYLSISKVEKHFRAMKKLEKSDAIYLTTSIWILYWLFEIRNIF